MTNTGVPLQEFILFPKLPTELRQEIWRLCRPEGRVVEFDIISNATLPPDPDLTPPSSDYLYWWDGWHQHEAYYGTTEARKDFSLLQVCKESRAVAMKTFRPILSSLLLNKCPFLVDFERDTVRLDDGPNRNLQKIFGLPNTERGGWEPEGPRLGKNQQKDLREFLGSVKHLELRRRLVVFGERFGVGDMDNFKSLKTFRAELEIDYAVDGPPRNFKDYIQWLEGSTQTKWEKTEEFRLPWAEGMIFKVTFENTGVAKAWEQPRIFTSFKDE
jgi:hypothetical protein